MKDRLRQFITRRNFLRASLGGAAGALGAATLGQMVQAQEPTASATPMPDTHSGNSASPVYTVDTHDTHGGMSLVGAVDPNARNHFDPMQMLVDWDYGIVSTLPSGQTLREYTVSAGDQEIEIAPGLYFPAWTFNGRVPGPAIRATEGDHIRINFSNFGTHPHTMHFHGFHPSEMDGVAGIGRGAINPGESFVYEFDAEPFGCHLYHCHALPLRRHIHKGMYGMFVIDPKAGRPPAREFMMVMNAFDTNFDGGNEIYAVNTVGHEFMHRPIPVKVGELVRVYLVNVIEFDLLNSFHIHANFFNYYDTGTTLEPTLRTIDTVMQAQGQRGILEFSFRWPGPYMFHAHVSEFAELGWMGLFNAVEEENFEASLAEVGVDTEWDRKGLHGSTVEQEAQS